MSKDHELCIKNKELSIKNKELCIKKRTFVFKMMNVCSFVNIPERFKEAIDAGTGRKIPKFLPVNGKGHHGLNIVVRFECANESHSHGSGR